MEQVIAGHKDFGNLIALLHNKKPVLGIINCPAHNERWIEIKQKTKCNGKNVQTSTFKKSKMLIFLHLDYILMNLKLEKD